MSMPSGIRWSEEQLQAHKALPVKTYPLSILQDRPAPIATGTPRATGMNKTEARYFARLQADPDVHWIGYEAVTLKLADDCRYTPDFAVMRSDGAIELHEVKGGFVREDAWVKVKVAAAKFPFQFVFAQEVKGVWTVKVL